MELPEIGHGVAVLIDPPDFPSLSRQQPAHVVHPIVLFCFCCNLVAFGEVFGT